MSCRAYISYVVKHLISNRGFRFATTDQEPRKTNLKVIFAILIGEVVNFSCHRCLRNDCTGLPLASKSSDIIDFKTRNA